MDKNIKISTVIGVILYALAAFFSVAFLLVLFDFAGIEAVSATALYKFGKVFTRVYGICSVLIPIFLVVAAFECFMRNWHIKNGVILAGSVIPFFTLDAIEHMCRMIIKGNTGDPLVMKLTATFLTGGIIIALEYLVLSILGDAIEFAGKDKKEKEIKEETQNSNQSQEREEEISEDENDIEAEGFEAEQEEEGKAESPEQGDFNVKNEEASEAAQDNGSNAEEFSDENNPFMHVFDEQDKAAQEQLAQAESAPVQEDSDSQKNINEADDSYKEGNSLEDEEPEPEEIPLSEEDFDLPDLTDEFSGDDDFYADNNDSNVQPETEENFNYQDDEAYSDYTQEQDSSFEDFDFPEETEIDDNLETEKNDENVDSQLLSLPGYKEENDSDETTDSVRDYFSDSTELEEDSEEVTEDKDEPLDNSSDDFGDDTTDFEGNGSHDDISDFVEERNNSFASIFAQMDKDAAEHPVESAEDSEDNGFDDIFNTKEDDKDIPQELENDPSVKAPYEGFEFDPSADPVVDSNGLPFGPAIPFNIGENSFDEVAKAKREAKPISFAEKAVFLQDSEKEKLGKSSALNAADEQENAVKEAEAQPHNSSALSSSAQKESKPKLRLSNYKIPVEGILQKYDNGEYWLIDDETKEKAAELKKTLSEFNIDVDVTGIRKGPVVTMFEVLPAPGVNVNRIRTLQDNIALRLAATSVRIVSPIPGKSAVGIEIPNKKRAIVSFREIIEQQNPAFEKMAIPVILGKDISGEPRVIDLTKTPHLLIAGSTGSGKSVCVNSLILSILYKRAPNQVKLILIDPKVVELKLYNDIPHLLTPVITEPKKALQALQYCLCEMERRYALLDNMGVRDIASYNRRITERKLMQEKIPYIVIIIDEFADLMATTGKELESNVARLAAMSRAVGIHLVLATQRPSVNVITGLIKANIPSRIAFMVASRTDSNIIIDQIGAEKLLGKGDMLYASATDPFPVRIQGTLVGDDEVEKVVDYVKQYGEPDYIDDEIFVDDDDEDSDGNAALFGDGEDPLYDRALEIVVQSGKASASYLQRRLKIGYNRAARLVEEMEERGIVGPQNGSKPREVIHMP